MKWDKNTKSQGKLCGQNSSRAVNNNKKNNHRNWLSRKNMQES